MREVTAGAARTLSKCGKGDLTRAANKNETMNPRRFSAATVLREALSGVLTFSSLKSVAGLQNAEVFYRQIKQYFGVKRCRFCRPERKPAAP